MHGDELNSELDNERLRIGAVSYLNTKPLVFGLEHVAPPVEVIYQVPSRLADDLALSKLDVGLIPVVEAISNPQYTIVSDACIACRGPVGSVKLFSRVPFDGIKTLALDEGSRTSVILTRIILKQKFNVEPDCRKLPIDKSWLDLETDAALVIGDRAMHGLNRMQQLERGFEFELDLGEFWNVWTELPFVFAVWAARPNVNFGCVDDLLTTARDKGLNNIELICQLAESERGFDRDECRDYLTRNLHFQLGPREKQGMNLFFEYAKQQELLKPELNLHFHDCQTTG